MNGQKKKGEEQGERGDKLIEQGIRKMKRNEQRGVIKRIRQEIRKREDERAGERRCREG